MKVLILFGLLFSDLVLSEVDQSVLNKYMHCPKEISGNAKDGIYKGTVKFNCDNISFSVDVSCKYEGITPDPEVCMKDDKVAMKVKKPLSKEKTKDSNTDSRSE